MNPLHTRKVGRTVLAIYAAAISTAALGKARTRTGMDTTYRVVALANTGRDGRTLGSFPTLATAQEYVAAYSDTYGLLSR